MRENPNFKNLALVLAVLALSALIFISDIICGNIFGATISMVLIVEMCFVLGYIYSKFEKWNADNGVSMKFFEKKKEEKVEIGSNLSIDELLEITKKENSEEDIDKNAKV